LHYRALTLGASQNKPQGRHYRQAAKHYEENSMVAVLKSLHREESGQDLVEYALIGLLIALGALTGMGRLASSINAEFTKIAGKLT
jgi:Flp pilus assembly pilin Flp